MICGQHFNDVPVGGRRRRRKISNWLNYRGPGGEWRPSSPVVESAQGAPPDWSGAFDFSYQSREAPLQCFLRDAADVGNRALVGVRLAESPGSWLNLKALDCAAVDAMVEGAAVRWPELWPHCDLVYRPGRHKLTKEIICHAPGHPTTFAFSLRTAPGHSIVFAGGGAKVVDDGGTEAMQLNPPWARDSSTTHPTPDGHKTIGVTLREGEPRVIGGRAHQVVELVVDEADLEGAVYPVTIDPTVQITGTTDLEDGLLSGPGCSNYGGRTTIYAGNSDAFRSVIRIATVGPIPAGTITALRLIAFCEFVSTAPLQTIVAHIIASANDWVEGTLDGGSEFGSYDYNHLEHDTIPWIGSAGCGTSGVDYDADATPPELTIPASGNWETLDLKPEWAVAWRDATRHSNGIRMAAKTSAGGFVIFASSESTTNPLYFEVDYEEAGASIAAMALPRRIHE